MAFDNRMSSFLEIQNAHFWAYTSGLYTRMEGIAAFSLRSKNKDGKVAKSWVKPVKLLLTKALLQVLKLKTGLPGLVP